MEIKPLNLTLNNHTGSLDLEYIKADVKQNTIIKVRKSMVKELTISCILIFLILFGSLGPAHFAPSATISTPPSSRSACEWFE